MPNSYKQKHNFSTRLDESIKIFKKYDDKLPIIITKSKKSNITEMKNQKFLVPNDLTIGQLMYIVRKRLKIDSEEAVYLLVNDEMLVENSKVLSVIYDEYKDEDGFLYISYCGENVFGNFII